MIWVLGAFLAVLVALAVALLLLVRARRRRRRLWARRQRSVQLRCPIVLAHGVLGFDQLPLLGPRAAYFRSVTPHLVRLGLVVHCPRVPPLASVEARAVVFARFIERLPYERVNVVAHSMGGLDARYAIARLGLGKRVASLTTIGTPHFGTPLADVSAQVIARLCNLGRPAAWARAPRAWALRSLTTEALARFNEEIADVDDVAYGSIVAAIPSEARPVNLLLRFGHAFLLPRGGPNDGIVPARSQSWGEVLAEVEADHWAQVGWSIGFDTRGLYEELLRELYARGF